MSDPLADVIREADAEWWSGTQQGNRTRRDLQVAAVRSYLAEVLDAEDVGWRRQFYDDPEAMHLWGIFLDGMRTVLLAAEDTEGSL